MFSPFPTLLRSSQLPSPPNFFFLQKDKNYKKLHENENQNNNQRPIKQKVQKKKVQKTK